LLIVGTKLNNFLKSLPHDKTNSSLHSYRVTVSANPDRQQGQALASNSDCQTY